MVCLAMIGMMLAVLVAWWVFQIIVNWLLGWLEASCDEEVPEWFIILESEFEEDYDD